MIKCEGDASQEKKKKNNKNLAKSKDYKNKREILEYATTSNSILVHTHIWSCNANLLTQLNPA